MSVDPTALAQEQERQQRLMAAGEPQTVAASPDQQGIQVASTGDLFKLLGKLDKSVTPPKPKPATVTKPLTPSQLQQAGAGATQPGRIAPRMPTPQEAGLVPDTGAFSETATKRALAGQVLSPEGVKKFEERGLKAPGIGEEPPVDVLQDAQSALTDEAAEAERLAVDVNQQAQKALTAEKQDWKTQTGAMADDITDQIIDRVTAQTQNIKSLQDGGDFNFDYMNTTDDVKAVITAIGETYADETVARTRGKVSNKLTISEAAGLVADEIGFSRSLLSRKIGDRPLTAAEFVGARELLVRSATKLEEMAKKIKSGQADATDRLKFRRQLSIHSGIQLQLKGAQTEAARALQSFQIPVTGEMDAIRYSEEAQRILKDSGSEEATDALADRLLKAGKENGIKGINDLANGGWYAKTKQMVHEAYLAGLLSSPATQAKNVIGTAAFMMFQLPTEVIAGMYGSVIRTGRKQLGMQFPISEDQVYMEDALFRMKGWSDAFKDAMKAASIAWRTEMPAGASKLDVEQYSAIAGQSDSFFGRSVDELGKRMRIPFRLLLSADEFTKTISQRGEFYTAVNKRYQHALRKGMTNQEALDEAGMLLLDPRAIADDLDIKAKFDTLQSDLGMFGKVTGMLQRTLVGRFLLPFATAPTNALLRTMEYTPFSKSAIDALGKNGPQAQQMALGRMSLGGATMYTVGQYAQDGRMTGGMPSDQKQREALPPGWQPYSFVLRGEGFPTDENGEPLPLYDAFGAPNGPLTYVSYAGFEPIGGLLAITADTMQRMNNTDDPALQQNFAAAAMIATADYYKELPMLQGIADLVSFMDGYDGAKLLRSYAESSTITGLPNPLSSMQRMIQRLVDPTSVRPREDIQYYTEEDILETYVDEDGTTRYRYEEIDGSPRYKLIGQPKTDEGRKVFEFFAEMNALQAKDSFFRDERDYNAVVYDTLGNVKGKDEFSFANRPGAALFSNISGIRLKRGEELQDYEKELIRLQRMTGNWPLSNPKEYKGIKLSYGMQSDLIEIAKNLTTVRYSGYGDLTFRETLEIVMAEPSYMGLTDKQQVTMLQAINKQFIDEGFKTLIELPEYANMRQAYLDLQAQKERE